MALRFQMNVGDRLAKKNFQWIAALFPKKKDLRKRVSYRMDTLEKVV